MKVLYFIVCLLLVACGGDDQPEVNQPFELKNKMCIRDRFSIRLNGIHYTTELGSEYDCSLNLHHL